MTSTWAMGAPNVIVIAMAAPARRTPPEAVAEARKLASRPGAASSLGGHSCREAP